MNPKMRNTLAAFAMLASMSGMKEPHDYDAPPKRKIKRAERNSDKKCFRKACDKNRSGNKLYCSAECNKLDKIERKNKTK